ncbi:MAG: helix-turn-helix domain-containing protein [Pseudomonadota bacterium]
MPKRDIDPVKLTLDLVGDGWTFQILKASFFGARRFDDFQIETGAAPSILSARLKKLVDAEIFEKIQYSDHARRFDYRLTVQGLELYPLIILMRQWGEKWLGSNDQAIKLKHNPCGKKLNVQVTCSSCGKAVTANDVSWERL